MIGACTCQDLRFDKTNKALLLLYLFYSYVNCMQIEKVGDLLPAPREEALL